MDEDLTLAQQSVIMDLSLYSPERLSRDQIGRLAQHIRGFKYPLVYNAFDGDHFSLTPLMRRYTLRHHAVPANPESILGYKDTVMARTTKHGVLRDDLAVLGRCDELWVFTDLEPEPSSVASLAEGVLVEIIYYLLSNENAVVKFVPATDLLTVNSSTLEADPTPVTVPLSVEDIRLELDDRDFEEIIAFVGGRSLEIAATLPKAAFIIFDLQDSKYMHWLRGFALDSRDTVGIVPTLAIELGDILAGSGPLGCLLVSWAHLIKLADVSWELPPLEGRTSGNVYQLLKVLWSLERSMPPKQVSWEQVKIPKARLGERWALTPKEQAPWRSR